jgi:acetolactate decarboxylase
MKKTALLLLSALGLLMVISAACAPATTGPDILFQTSPFVALQQGDFDGAYKCGDLKQHGDYGLGTVDNLNGEMIMVDGIVYQIKIDGIAYIVDDSAETPFAAVTFFQNDKTVNIAEADSSAQLQQLLDANLSTDNTFYAIRIEGNFDYIKTRSVPAQSKPYPTLVDAVQDQAVFEFENVKGTIFGLRCPPYIGVLNVPGYHFHFLTADKKAGGHLLDCRMHDVSAEIDETNAYYIAVPTTEDFIEMNFAEQSNPELDKIEK